MPAKKKTEYSELTADLLSGTDKPAKKARQKISIDVDAELYEPFKRFASFHSRTMGSIIEELIRRYREENAAELAEWDAFAGKQRTKRNK